MTIHSLCTAVAAFPRRTIVRTRRYAAESAVTSAGTAVYVPSSARDMTPDVSTAALLIPPYRCGNLGRQQQKTTTSVFSKEYQKEPSEDVYPRTHGIQVSFKDTASWGYMGRLPPCALFDIHLIHTAYR